MTPVTVPSVALNSTRTFEEWVSDVHGGSGRLLIWDETLGWWCVQDPDLEAMVTCAPIGRFSPYSDELSWLSFGTEAGRRSIEQLCARYGLHVPKYADFVAQAHLFVWEEGQLFELPTGVRELTTQGWVRHGPWRPAWCSEALLAWLTSGLLSVFADDRVRQMPDAPEGWFDSATTSQNKGKTLYDLAGDDARTVLTTPDEWRIGTARGLLMCSPTAKGVRTPYADWVRLLPFSERGACPHLR
jgi:hypothetical protein